MIEKKALRTVRVCGKGCEPHNLERIVETENLKINSK